MFHFVNETSFAEICASAPTVLIGSVNYEERSVHFLLNHLRRRAAADPEREPIFVRILWPKGDFMRVDLLEQLKSLYFSRLEPHLAGVEYDIQVVPYPDNYNEPHVAHLIKTACGAPPGERYNLVVDISAMPRKMLVSTCRAVEELISGDGRRPSTVHFVYTSAERYSSMGYAENVGALKGYFSGRALHEHRCNHVTALVFPGLQGFEGRLLFDEVRSRPNSSIAALVAASGTDYLTSLSTMRANQFLMEERSVDIVYYFSLRDGIVRFFDRLSEIAKSPGVLRDGTARGLTVAHSQMLWVAPFGPKVFTLAAYFGVRRLRRQNTTNLEVEIAHVGGFQYLSVYSLGATKSAILGLDQEEALA